MNLKVKKREEIKIYSEENQITLYSTFIALLDSSEIDLDTHDKETTEPNINVVVKIY